MIAKKFDPKYWEWIPSVLAFRNRSLGEKLLRLAAGSMRITPFTFTPTAHDFKNMTIPLTEIGTPVKLGHYTLNDYDPNSILQRELWYMLGYEIECAAAVAFQKPHAPLWRMPGDLRWTLSNRGLYYLQEHFECEPPFVGFASKHQLRFLMRNIVWEPWFQYLQNGDLLYHGEVGRTGMIRWIEVPLLNLFNWKPVIFGDNPVGRIEVETPCLWANEDFTIVTMKGLFAFFNYYKLSRITKIIKFG